MIMSAQSKNGASSHLSAVLKGSKSTLTRAGLVHLEAATLDWPVQVAAAMNKLHSTSRGTARSYLSEQASDLIAWLAAPSVAFARANCRSAFGDSAAFEDVPMAALQIVVGMASSSDAPKLDSSKGAARAQGQWMFAVLWSFRSAMSPQACPLSCLGLSYPHFLTQSR